MRLARRAGLRTAPALLALSLLAGSAAGQSGWVVDASAGGAEHDPVAARIDTRSAVLGLLYQGPAWLYLSAAAPLDSEGLPWGAAGVGSRLETRRAGIGLGADLGLHAFGYRDPTLDEVGGGGTVEALPFVALARGNARLEVGSGLLHYRSRFGGETVLRRTLHQSAARLAYFPSPRLRLEAETRLARAEEGDYPFAGAGADLSLPRGLLWGRFGRWLSDDMDGPVWSVGGSLRVTERVRVRASYERASEDPLYWNLPRRSWSVGVSHALGGAPRRAAPAAIAPAAPAGSVTLRLPLAEAAEAPAVAGDFNDWTPVPMTRAGDAWTLTLPLEPGVYRYAFRRADGSWFVPESVPGRVDDGFGGHSAVLVVQGPPGG